MTWTLILSALAVPAWLAAVLDMLTYGQAAEHVGHYLLTDTWG